MKCNDVRAVVKEYAPPEPDEECVAEYETDRGVRQNMIPVDPKMKELFFDKQHVQKRIGKAKSKVMSKGLAFVRQIAASGMRKRRKSLQPGQPPSRHFGGRFEGLGKILFYYDPGKESGVVGP